MRYNKPSITGPRDQADPTIANTFYTKATQKQLLADANKVYGAVKANPKVDPARLYLYGWSEGTTHAAQRGAIHPEVAGLILQGPVPGTLAETFQYQLLVADCGHRARVIRIGVPRTHHAPTEPADG